jgi:hypothetical protein
MAYVTYDEFVNSPYGADFQPGNSIFETSGQVVDFLDLISNLIDLYCSRTFVVTQYADSFDGEGNSVLFLRAFPATGIISIQYEKIGDSTSTGFISASTYNLFKRTGKIRLSNTLSYGYFYTVNYFAGYESTPDPIKQATLMLANSYAQSIDNGSVGIPDGGAITEFRFSKFMERYTDTRHKNQASETGIPFTVKAILDKYRFLG